MTDRPDAIYQRGQTVTFRITLKDGDRPLAGQPVEYRIIKDGLTTVASGSITSADQPVAVTASAKEPGFIRCDLASKPPAATQPVTASAGAGIEPDQIKPSLPVPDDFDAFWTKQKARLDDEPAKPVLTPVKSPAAGIDVVDVQINCPGGAPVSGYLAIPQDAKPKSIGAILYTHSAGVRGSDLPHAIRGAKLGLIALDINAHGLPNGKPDAFYLDLYNNGLKDYPTRGLDDREKVYFGGMYLRVQRALNYLASRPEWNGKVLIAEGSSQGGGQSLVAAGMDSRVTLCLAAVPAMCDHTAYLVNRTAGWPRMLTKGKDGKYDEKATQVSRYVDAMNFATRIKCPTYVTVGFIDRTCAPASVYAGYNNVGAKEKHIINRPGMGHAFPADLIAEFDEIIRGHVAAAGK